MKQIANIKVGKPAVTQTLPAHVPGVREGNAPGSIEAAAGYHRSDGGLQASARRSTGITPDASAPIDPKSPVLTPA